MSPCGYKQVIHLISTLIATNSALINQRKTSHKNHPFSLVKSPCSYGFRMVLLCSSMVFLLVSSHFGATATSNHSPRCPSEPQPSVGMQRSQLQRLTNHATAEPAKFRPSCLTMTWRVYESLPINNMGFILVICKSTVLVDFLKSSPI